MPLWLPSHSLSHCSSSVIELDHNSSWNLYFQLILMIFLFLLEHFETVLLIKIIIIVTIFWICFHPRKCFEDDTRNSYFNHILRSWGPGPWFQMKGILWLKCWSIMFYQVWPPRKNLFSFANMKTSDTQPRRDKSSCRSSLNYHSRSTDWLPLCLPA